MIEDVSCIRFRPQREVQHKDHIEFIAGRGCFSPIGRSGHGKQEILLRRECAKDGIHLILHEVSGIPLVNCINLIKRSHYYFRSSTLLDFTMSINGLIVINISKSIGMKFLRVLKDNS